MTPLGFRLHVASASLRILFHGPLCATVDAQVLTKVVIGTLRAYRIRALELDLTEVGTIDPVGVAALLDSSRRAMRYGVPLAITGTSAPLRAILARYAVADLLTRRPPPRQPQTGTVCQTSWAADRASEVHRGTKSRAFRTWRLARGVCGC